MENLGLVDEIQEKVDQIKREIEDSSFPVSSLVFKEGKFPLGISHSISDLLNDSMEAVRLGDWDLAVKFTQHANQVAKSFGSMACYELFLTLSSCRDTLKETLSSVQKFI